MPVMVMRITLLPLASCQAPPLFHWNLSRIDQPAREVEPSPVLLVASTRSKSPDGGP